MWKIAFKKFKEPLSFLKVVLHKIYLVCFWIFCFKCNAWCWIKYFLKVDGYVKTYNMLLSNQGYVITIFLLISNLRRIKYNFCNNFCLQYFTTECGDDLRSSGTVFSPNYPNPYPFNRICWWYLQSAFSELIVELTFHNLDVEETVNCTNVRQYMKSKRCIFDLGLKVSLNNISCNFKFWKFYWENVSAAFQF